MTQQQKEKSTAVATVDPGSFSIMQLDHNDLVGMIRENLGGQAIKTQDFDTIKVPAGGATTWTVPSLEGDQEVKEVVGVIIYKNIQRAYWPGQFTGDGTPPVCSSKDSLIGVGTPGGDCSICPHAQFGSKGAGQQCSQFQPIFLLQQGDVIPKVVRVSAGSLGNLKKYFLRLSSQGTPYWKVVTSLSLQKEKNATGIAYSEIVPKMVCKLDEAQAAVVRKYIDTMEPVLNQVHAERTPQRADPKF